MTLPLPAPSPELLRELRALDVNVLVYAPETEVPAAFEEVLNIETVGAHPWDRLDDRGAVHTELPLTLLPADFYEDFVFPETGTVEGSGFSITIGLPYKASVETLPIIGQEGLRSHVSSMMVMMGRHENFCVGRVDALAKVRYGRYFFEGLTDTIVNRPVQIEPSYYHVGLPGGWDYAGSIFMEAQIGQPMEVLQIVLHDKTGDEIRLDQGNTDPAAAGS